MRFYFSMPAAIAAAAVLVAAVGCDDRGGPAPPKPPAPRTDWQGEDTGYRAMEPAGRAKDNGPPAVRR